jgi:hypothetical protein
MNTHLTAPKLQEVRVATPWTLLQLGHLWAPRPICKCPCSSETSVVTQRTTWRHIPEDDTLQSNAVQPAGKGGRREGGQSVGEDGYGLFRKIV